MHRHRGKQGQENASKGPLRDLDLHHPPCRGYRANQAFYALGWIAQVLLRAVQFTALPKLTRKHGLRPVIRHVMRTAAYMVRTARRLCVRFAKTNFHLDWLYEAMMRLEPRAPLPRTAASTIPTSPTPPCGGYACSHCLTGNAPLACLTFVGTGMRCLPAWCGAGVAGAS
ncbi:MAG: hypothetical protein OXH68_20920 [Gammaproteobacteria bacterium]|nr:hypothetical protein [Gammaproteobacteria bacterium]